MIVKIFSNWRVNLSGVNALRLYALIILIAFDRYYFFHLCYFKNSTFNFHFNFNAPCIYVALSIIGLTGLLQVIITIFFAFIYRLFHQNRKPSLLFNIISVGLATWALYLMKLFALTS